MPRKKGSGRVVTTNIRVTKETHRRIQILTEFLDMEISEAIDTLIAKVMPEINEEMRRRDDARKSILGEDIDRSK